MVLNDSMRRATFLAKIVGAVALIGLADFLFYGEEPGWTLGGFALAWAAVLALVRRDVRRSGPARSALAGAALFGAAMIDDPGPLDWVLFWTAIASAALLPLGRFDHAINWVGGLLVHAVRGLATPVRDLRRLMRPRRPAGRSKFRHVAATLALPVIGGGVFLMLFAAANPLIANAFAAIRFPDVGTGMLHLLFWSIVLLAIWPGFRPARAVLHDRGTLRDQGSLPSIPLLPLILSLVTFNAVFAIENVLDLVFLWSGAPLPAGVTLADYAHQGAYPLIVTALLAAGFVLIAARPGSAAAASPLVRRLIVLWVAQNLLLVASSIHRTLDYVAAYSLTGLRIAALGWMGLVAVGLVLITWRMLAGRTTRWLINANTLAAGVLLTAAAFSNLGAIAATWNVRHASRGEDLDLCYLGSLGPSALLPLIELEARAGGPVLRDRAAFLRARAMRTLELDQADWHRWTWRGARRLAAARERLGSDAAVPRKAQWGRDCDAAPNRPPEDVSAPPVRPTPTPLTKRQRP
ncbi:DUF4173 domain-containing protein [Sphingomonas sp. Y38-1Y]|uniref:DUF4153 domain-containing protein n=1 Tax=Sphingomonas sp. Y38-1Y TaxID=3078265 RepID=UPI0028E39227|nr:DUF4173 domain-containing protein [Sphingomonas sp. Y38-1Y]